MKTRRGKIMLMSESGYVAPPEKPAHRLPHRPPARPSQRNIRRAVAFFAPWPTPEKKP